MNIQDCLHHIDLLLKNVCHPVKIAEECPFVCQHDTPFICTMISEWFVEEPDLELPEAIDLANVQLGEILLYSNAPNSVSFSELFNEMKPVKISKAVKEPAAVKESAAVKEQSLHINLHPHVEYKSSTRTPRSHYKHITQRLDALRKKPQHPQRTYGWHLERYNKLTGSNFSKAYGSQAAKNSIIFQKAGPPPEEPDVAEVHSASEITTNLNSPMHWGVMTEPLSVMWYEAEFDTKIEEFGCLEHDEHSFLGASPDGINTDPNSPLYGRMLEIKNVVSRTITGIPKPEYMGQMQLQTEVADLDECDFLETKFELFDSEEEFFATEQDAAPRTCGCLMRLINPKEADYCYKYMPIDSPTDLKSVRTWQENALDEAKIEGLLWIQHLYWKLVKVSCVLIMRDRSWFNEKLPIVREVWDTVLRERITGCEHRAPKKRVTATKTTPRPSSILVTRLGESATQIPSEVKDEKKNEKKEEDKLISQYFFLPQEQSPPQKPSSRLFQRMLHS